MESSETYRDPEGWLWIKTEKQFFNHCYLWNPEHQVGTYVSEQQLADWEQISASSNNTSAGANDTREKPGRTLIAI